MHSYFRGREEAERLCQEARLPYRKRFFTDDCYFDSHAGALDMIRSERIESIETKGPTVFVVTNIAVDLRKLGKHVRRHRYNLEPSGETWVIRCVQMACPVCERPGQKSCRVCHGEYWLSHGE